MPSLNIPTLPDIVTSFGGPVHPDFVESYSTHTPHMAFVDKAEKSDLGEESDGATPYSASLAETSGESTSYGLDSDTASMSV